MDAPKYNTKDLQRVEEIYLISNTPRFFYNQLRKDSFVINLAKRPANDLIDEFIELSKNEITSINELVLLYSLYVALTYKEYKLVGHFFNKEGDINFEWFDVIKNIFISSYRPIINIEIGDVSIVPKIQDNSDIRQLTGQKIFYNENINIE